MTNGRFLKAAMIRNGYTAGSLADSIGLSRQSMSYKLNNKRMFTVDEIKAISEKLNLSLEEKEAIFFGNAVDK